MRNLLLSILALLAIIVEVSAQNSFEKMQKVVPPSPTVASLGKYGEVPVSMYTGIPSISIPIYDVKDGTLSLPISLSYHAGGVKVEEMASAVGLSWTLNAGGIIGRNVRGLPDESDPWQSRSRENTVEGIMESGDPKKIEQLALDVERGVRDGEADLYYFNFNGISGKFFFDQSGVVHTVPVRNIEIKAYESGWQIVTEDGTGYIFNKVEEIRSSSCNGDQSLTSAWFLTNIKSADGKRSISFTYEKVNYTYQTLIGQTKYFSVNGTGSVCMTNPSPCLGSQNYSTQRLARIDFGSGYIKFNYNIQRCDLPEDKSLDQISVYNLLNQQIKNYRMAYSYFGDNHDGCNYYTKDLKRLKLISVTESSGNATIPPYLFEYNELVELPSRLSYAQDHWGFYNGKLNNEGLISSFTTVVASGAQVVFPGADRKANPATAQAGILKKIKYPTGGETIFNYESNTVSDNQVEPQTTEKILFFGADQQQVSGLPNPYESDELTIPAGEESRVHFNVSGLGSNLWRGCDIVRCFLIKDNNTIPIGQIDDYWNDVYTTWPAGTYKLKLSLECGVISTANFKIEIRAEVSEGKATETRFVGGLRIKSVEDNPGNGGKPVIKKYLYTQDGNENLSSGTLINFPEYGYDLTVLKQGRTEQELTDGPPLFCNYRVRQSFSTYPLATSQGSFVGYSHVILDLGNNGQSRFSYEAKPDQKSFFPFAPVESFEWRRGFLLNTKDFTFSKEGLVLAREIQNTPVSYRSHRTYGIKTGKNNLIIDPVGSTDLNPDLYHVFFPTTTEFFSLGETVERTYDQIDPTKFIENKTVYQYSPAHLQLTQTAVTTSSTDGPEKEEIVTNKKYPFDYSITEANYGPAALGIKNLQARHIVDEVIEDYVVKRRHNSISNQLTDERVIAANVTTFKPDKPYPDRLYRLDIDAAIPLAQFSGGSQIVNLTTANPSLSNPYSTSVIFNSYDDNGNLTSQQRPDDLIKCYLWGYQSRYPVAEITGVDYESVVGTTNLNLALIQDPSTSDNSMRSELDKIRQQFPTAQVTTFTYKPLVGITSQTDLNNRTTYFEYDELNRLQLIRDQDKNILKKYEYSYGGTESICCQATFTNQAKSVELRKSDCAPGNSGSPVTYTVPAGKYTSDISQEAADARADADIQTNAANYANANGSCTPVYASLSYEYLFTDLSGTYAEVYIRFFSDRGKTKPVKPGNITVNYMKTDTYLAPNQWYYSIKCSDDVLLEYTMLQGFVDWQYRSIGFALLNGNYTIIY